MPEPDELTLAIARALEIDWQYAERVEAQDAGRIAQVRSAGRKAGRLLGFKIMTFQGQPGQDNRVAVIVAVREAPSEEEGERMAERANLLISDLLGSGHVPPPGA